MKSNNLSIVILVLLCTSLFACKKRALEFLGGAFAKEIWEDRAPGIACKAASSNGTLNAGELTFNTDHMLCVNIEMDAPSFEKLRNESRFGPDIREKDGATASAVLLEYLGQCGVPFPKEYNWYGANLKVDGLSQRNIGIRKKGFLGSIFSIAPALKIITDKYVPGQKVGTTHKITLNNNSEDPTRIIQCFNYKIFELAGYPAPRCNLANLSVNNEALGVYSHIEALGTNFLNRTFGNSSGHFYEGQLVDLVEEWTARWDAKTSSTPKLANSLRKLSDVLSNTPDEEVIKELDPILNIDQFITFWALEIILGHNDGYCSNRNNFFIYQNPADNDRATLIPWGLNYILDNEQKETKIKDFIGAQIPRRLSRIPEYRDSLKNRINFLLNKVWNENQLNLFIDAMALQVQTGQNDPNYASEIAQLKTWVTERKSKIKAELDAGIPSGSDKVSQKCFQNEE